MNLNDYYLDAMGIKRWHFRGDLIEAEVEARAVEPTLSHYVYQLFQNGKLRARLIIEATLKSPEEASLVKKIVQATKLEYQGGLVQEMPEMNLAGKVVRLAHSPADMLNDPSLKREVWQQLRVMLNL